MSNNNDVRKISRDLCNYQLTDNNGEFEYFKKKKRDVIVEYLNTQNKKLLGISKINGRYCRGQYLFCQWVPSHSTFSLYNIVKYINIEMQYVKCNTIIKNIYFFCEMRIALM